MSQNFNGLQFNCRFVVDPVEALRKGQIVGSIRTNLATVAIAFSLLFGIA